MKIEEFLWKNVRICGCGSCVVGETEPVPVVAAPFIEDTLVTAVPGGIGGYEVVELVKGVVAWSENENTRVEDVGPTDVWYGRKVVGKGEKMGKRSDGEDIGIEKDDLVVLDETKYMKLGKDSG